MHGRMASEGAAAYSVRCARARPNEMSWIRNKAVIAVAAWLSWLAW
jgi:hypothetical protein